MGTTAFGGAGVTIFECFSFYFKLDLHVLQGNLNDVAYRESNVLNTHVVLHFDNHSLADRPIFMDENNRPNGARFVREFMQQEAIDTFQWPAMSTDMTPVEHVCDLICRKCGIT